jgi:type VI secretion system protein ImpL
MVVLAYVLAVIVFLVAALVAWFAGSIFPAQGTPLLVIRIVIFLAGVLTAAAIVLLHLRSRKAQDQIAGADVGGSGSNGDLDALLQNAAAKLAASQRKGTKSLNELPLLYIFGDANSAKTTSILRSGLDPELLAGQVYQGGDVAPTALGNIWYGRQTAIIEIGEGLRKDPGALQKLVRRTSPKAYSSAFGDGAPPRAAVVCVSMETFLGADGASRGTKLAQTLGTQLRELARTLGTALPVYVLFTKLDRVPNFAEFVRNLSTEEAKQAMGLTLGRPDMAAGVYAEQASQQIGQALDQLAFSLGEFRLDLLGRETDLTIGAQAYEFPRELRKQRNNLTQFLVELSRQSQLSANPYLRGFYFTGVRAQIVEQAVSAAAPFLQVEESRAGATQMFSLREIRSAAPVREPAMVSQKVPQWSFLARIFPEIILGDRSALLASKESAPARVFRRALFGTITGLLAIYLLLLLISYGKNAALQDEVLSAIGAIPVSGPLSLASTGNTLAMTSQLQALDTLRVHLEQLESYEHDGAPLMYRWGLYHGSDLEASVRKIYFDRFRQLLLNPTQARFTSTLAALPDTALPDADYTAAYKPLKAYLITTTNPDKSTADFLTPVFLQYWLNGGHADPDQQRLARSQIDFYARELPRKNPYTIAGDMAAVTRARTYLSKFGGVQRIYQGMLASADKAGSTIDFNKQFQKSAETVTETHQVRGAFTRGGFAYMRDALLHPERYFNGETWVLGESAAPALDHSSVAQQLSDGYVSDYLTEWRAFLKGASVVGYRDLPDAANKLNTLTGPTSPLLELFYTISHNTAGGNPAIDPKIAIVFQPAQALVPPDSDNQYIGPGNKTYIDALVALQSAIGQVASSPAGMTDPSAAAPIISAATAAHTATKQNTESFHIDTQGHAEALVFNLMEAPIKSVELQVRGIGPEMVNAAGKSFCAAFNQVTAKYPFSANVANPATPTEVEAVFAPETGSLWQFYDKSLKLILATNGSRYSQIPGASAQVTAQFNQFFNRAAAVSAGLFPAGAKSPTLSFTLHSIASPGIRDTSFTVDSERLSGMGATQQFTWNAVAAQQAAVTYNTKDMALQYQGTWALFQLVNKGHENSTNPYGLVYPLEFSGVPQKLPDGTPLAVHFEIYGPGASMLTPGALSGLHCVGPVAH